jgi:predicted HTH transcriptional regulator
MDKSLFLNKLTELEWEDFEVKEAKAEVPKSSWETVSAFANTSGGWLVFGVKQTGSLFEIQGVANPEKIEQDFLNTVRSEKFNVYLGVKSVKYEFEGKVVLAFYIVASNKKPVYFNTQANTYIRRGSADNKATKEEIDAMYRDQTFGSKSSEKVIGTSRDSLNKISLHRYRDYMTRFNPNVSYNRFDEDEFLEKLRIIEDGCCTYSGLLLCLLHNSNIQILA